MPTRLALVRRLGSVDLDLTKARFAGPVVVIELDMRCGSVAIRLPDGASASIDDVEVYFGSAKDHRRDAPAEGTPHVVLAGRVVCGSVDIRAPAQAALAALNSSAVSMAVTLPASGRCPHSPGSAVPAITARLA